MDNPFVFCDVSGQDIDRGCVEERLLALNCYEVINDAAQGDYEYLAAVLAEGTVGYYKMSNEDLLMEWEEQKDKFMQMMEANLSPFPLLEDDPLNSMC